MQVRGHTCRSDQNRLADSARGTCALFCLPAYEASGSRRRAAGPCAGAANGRLGSPRGRLCGIETYRVPVPVIAPHFRESFGKTDRSDS